MREFMEKQKRLKKQKKHRKTQHFHIGPVLVATLVLGTQVLSSFPRGSGPTTAILHSGQLPSSDLRSMIMLTLQTPP